MLKRQHGDKRAVSTFYIQIIKSNPVIPLNKGMRKMKKDDMVTKQRQEMRLRQKARKMNK